MRGEKTNRITVLVLLFLAFNSYPVLMEKAFSDSGFPPVLLGLNWVLFTAIVLFVIYLVRTRVAINSHLLNGILFVSGLLFSCYTVLGIDRMIGALRPELPAIVFDGPARINFQTSEFDMSASINSMGFRGEPVDLADSNQVRAIAIGDSFTFGWGVDDDSTWVARIGTQLKQRHVELLNLGKPGITTGEYLRIAQKAIPVIRPKYLLLGLLQGEDLAQLVLDTSIRKGVLPPSCGVPARNVWLNRNLSNLMAMIANDGQIDATAFWECEAKQVLQRFTSAQKLRYDAVVSNTVKKAFESGGLNPTRVYRGVVNPNRFYHLEESSDSLTQLALQAMKNDLTRIAQLCSAYEVQLIVVYEPSQLFACDKERRHLSELGYTLPQSLAVDSLYSSMQIAGICQGLNISFISSFPTFQSTCETTDLFFSYDGHYNPTGHGVFARELYAQLLHNL